MADHEPDEVERLLNLYSRLTDLMVEQVTLATDWVAKGRYLSALPAYTKAMTLHMRKVEVLADIQLELRKAGAPEEMKAKIEALEVRLMQSGDVEFKRLLGIGRTFLQVEHPDEPELWRIDEE